MSENFPIEIRDTEGTLLAQRDCEFLISPSDLLELLEGFRETYICPGDVRFQVTQWMPDKKGHITIGDDFGLYY